jgi:CMP-N-acetylneuraminic acid synthetase
MGNDTLVHDNSEEGVQVNLDSDSKLIPKS